METVRQIWSLIGPGQTLHAQSGLTAYDDCNPMEYNAAGEKIVKSEEQLGIVTDFEKATSKAMEQEIAKRTRLNECRSKFDHGAMKQKFKHYNDKAIRVRMAAFCVLDENDDLLIDSNEFVSSLKHFKHTAENSIEMNIFRLADTKGTQVIDFEEFLELCSIVEGHTGSSEKAKGFINSSTFKDFLNSQVSQNTFT